MGKRHSLRSLSLLRFLSVGLAIYLMGHSLAGNRLVTARAEPALLTAERQKNFGIAHLENEQPAEAVASFRQVVKAAPQQVLGYANLGLAYLRMGQLEAAAYWLKRADQVDANNADVWLLIAEVHQADSDLNRALAAALKAERLKPKDLRIRYFAYQAARAQRGDPAARAIAAREITRLFALAPGNLTVLLKYGRFCAEQQDRGELTAVVSTLQTQLKEMRTVERQLARLTTSVAHAAWETIGRELAVLENVLRPTRRYRQALFELEFPLIGIPILRFDESFYRRLTPRLPRQVTLEFTSIPSDQLPAVTPTASQQTAGRLDFADVDQDGQTDVLATCCGQTSGRTALWLVRSGQWNPTDLGDLIGRSCDARFVDLDNDGAFEVIAVGKQGLQIVQQDSSGRWAEMPCSADLSTGPGYAVNFIDADNDGDLDLCGAMQSGLHLWQYGADGKLRDISSDSGLAVAGPAVRQVVVRDFDDDLDSDLLIRDQLGQMQLLDNRRHGRFVKDNRGLSESACREFIVADLDNNGLEDVVFIDRQGQLWWQRNRWQENDEPRFAPALQICCQPIAVDTMTALDGDNDGWQDLIVAGRQEGKSILLMLRNLADGTWRTERIDSFSDRLLAIAGIDLDRDGDLDLLGLSSRGTFLGWRNEGGNANHWLNVRLRGLQIAGSKNNLHGIGSKIEIKAGFDYQRQTVRQPVTHFGLGAHRQADLMRVMWSNGVPQNQLQPSVNQTIMEPQILKGSCPNLYCWNGEEFVFVTDLLAGAPLGLQLAQGVIAPDHPRELMTIPRDQIGLRESEFVFQYTSELWETVYLDQAELWVIDHPAENHVLTDQRFMPPPYSAPQPILAGNGRPPIRAEDTAGRDVTERLREFDHRYPEQLQTTRYQGVVEPHTLTLDFGNIQEIQHPLLAIRCWIFWTDTSINVARSQAEPSGAEHTVVETWHPSEGWRPWNQPFGMPNGKDKWVVLDLSETLDRERARVRLRTTSQIYWDQALLVDQKSAVPHTITRLQPSAADLHWGGFHRLYRPTPDGPHLYAYGDRVNFPVWHDMRGFVTRYGDVTSLLTATDDRYVIFTAGDEITIRFDAASLGPLKSGWQRDYLFYSDGWEKDADRNTVTGQTVTPLPFHGMSRYPYNSPETFPDSAAHRDFRKKYLTRRIGPRRFRQFVRDFQVDEPVPLLPWASEPGTRGDHSH